ncbi:MAG: hypothetical protein ACYS22_16210 [Planctomycetota bacterium]
MPHASTSQRRPGAFGSVFALGRLTARETLTSTSTLLGLFAGLAAIVALCPSLVLVGFGERDRLVAELTLSTLRLAALIAAIGFATLLAHDRESGFLSTVAARPTNPASYVAGRLLGALFALAALLCWLSAVRGLVLYPKTPTFTEFVAGPYRTWLEGVALLGWAALCGSALGRGAAGAATGLGFVAAHVLGTVASTRDAFWWRPLLPDLPAIGAPELSVDAASAARAHALAILAVMTYGLGAAAVQAWRESHGTPE